VLQGSTGRSDFTLYRQRTPLVTIPDVKPPNGDAPVPETPNPAIGYPDLAARLKRAAAQHEASQRAETQAQQTEQALHLNQMALQFALQFATMHSHAADTSIVQTARVFRRFLES
jgi:hypothetical protein